MSLENHHAGEPIQCVGQNLPLCYYTCFQPLLFCLLLCLVLSLSLSFADYSPSLIMSILSTLRPLSSRVQDTLWWILAYLSAPVQMQMTFNDLNDDCLLLLLLELLSLPQLLQLRAVSRRLCYLIERYRLPKYQTLLYGYSKGEKEAREANSADQSVLLHVSTHLYAYSEFNLKRRLSLCDLCDLSFVSPPRLIFPLKRLVFPLSLPSLLPGLASLTATRFLVNKGVPLSEEASQVNRIMAHYLRSSWTETLVSLHLYIHVPTRPQPETEFWGLLGDLSILKYLSIEFSHFAQDYFSSSFLPDSLSVLGRLTSFSLSNYGGPNIPLLLSQLADNLTYLSLWDIACSVEECTAFFKSKPTYSRTLKTLEILLHGPVNWAFDWRIITMTAQHLPSLERAVLNFVSLDVSSLPDTPTLLNTTSFHVSHFLLGRPCTLLC